MLEQVSWKANKKTANISSLLLVLSPVTNSRPGAARTCRETCFWWLYRVWILEKNHVTILHPTRYLYAVASRIRRRRRSPVRSPTYDLLSTCELTCGINTRLWQHIRHGRQNRRATCRNLSPKTGKVVQISSDYQIK